MINYNQSPVLSVLNSVAALAVDVSVAAGHVSITGLPKFLRKDVKDNQFDIKPFLNETFTISNVYATSLIAGQAYAFKITQEVAGVPVVTLVHFTPNVAQAFNLGLFADGLTAVVQGFITSGILKATAAPYVSGFDAGVEVTGITDYPILSAMPYATSSTAASLLTSVSGYGLEGAVSATIAGLTITVDDANHTMSVGDSVHLTGYDGSINGVTSAAGGLVLRVDAETAGVGFTLTVQSEVGYATGAADYSKVAQFALGAGADLYAQYSYLQGGASIVSVNRYHIVDITGMNSNNGGQGFVETPTEFQHLLLINASDIDALDLVFRIGELKSWFAAGTTNFDPALMA